MIYRLKIYDNFINIQIVGLMFEIYLELRDNTVQIGEKQVYR